MEYESKEQKVHPLVKQYVGIEKKNWSELLAKQGYSNIEEDLTDDGN